MKHKFWKRTMTLAGVYLFLLMSPGVFAFSYLAADVSQATVTGASIANFEPHGLRLRAGVRFSRNFDVELALGGNTEVDGDVFDSVSANYAGVYIKGYAPIKRNFGVYLLAGGSAVAVTQTISTSRFSESTSGLTYGFGIESQLTPEFNISADYIVYSRESDKFPEIRVVAIGVKWNM